VERTMMPILEATMVHRARRWYGWRQAGGCCVLAILALSGCSHPAQYTAGTRNGNSAPALTPGSPDFDAAKSLSVEVAALDATVAADEAWRVAARAYEYSRELARRYHMVHPAAFQNILVNFGLKKRGLCYHWAEDLMRELETLAPRTLEFHWAIAREGSMREHNSVVVTARAQHFEQGIVLDGWRHSGRLYWAHVTADRYPWKWSELATGPAVGLSLRPR
jgi:hypothetical protein